MRIGILTFHAAQNYGAVLQCFALQTYLESMGHEVMVVDYRSKALLHEYQVFDLKRFLSLNPSKCLRKFKTEVKMLPLRKLRSAAFEAFVDRHLHVCPVRFIDRHPFDVIFVGSDQVWNTRLTGGFDQYYWGDFNRPPQTVLASYAASMEDNPTSDKCREITRRLENFSFISVREKTLAQLLSEKCKKEISYAVDPTLLVGSQRWSQLAGERIVKEDYVFLYEVNPLPKAELMAADIAKSTGKRLITLSSLLTLHETKLSASASPITFLNLFKYADIVVAASFHGTVFSLVFSKPFVSIKANNGKDGRTANLLASVGLSHRFVDHLNASQLRQLLSENISVNLDTEERQQSVNYISKILDN